MLCDPHGYWLTEHLFLYENTYKPQKTKKPSDCSLGFLNLEREISFDLTLQPWKGCALPLKLFPHCKHHFRGI
jgi:hypothetical protein